MSRIDTLFQRRNDSSNSQFRSNQISCFVSGVGKIQNTDTDSFSYEKKSMEFDFVCLIVSRFQSLLQNGATSAS